MRTTRLSLHRRHSAPSASQATLSHSHLATALALTALAALASLAMAPAAGANHPDLLTRLSANGGTSASGAGELGNPRAVAASPATGHIYVSESLNSRISEFTAWGHFVRAWGWDVAPEGQPGDTPADQLEVCGPPTPQELPDPGLCKAGVAGDGVGQLNGPQGLAVDAAGSIYVSDRKNQRVQKFDPDGSFALAWGGDVVAHGPDDSSNDEQQQFTVAADSGTFTLSLAPTFGGGATQQSAPIPYDATPAEVKAALEAMPTVGGLGGTVSVSGGPGDTTGSSPYQVDFGGNLAGDDVPQLAIDTTGLGLAVGSQFNCQTSASAQTVSYRWLRNGTLIPGAESPSYTAVAADAGAAIQCQVFAFNSGQGATQAAMPSFVVSPHPGPAPPVFVDINISHPTASATLTVGGPGGQILTCDPEASNWVGASSFSYRWYRNGTEIPGATASTYAVSAADLATPARFNCAAIATNTGGTKVLKVSFDLLSTNPGPSGIPEVNGTATPTMAPAITPGMSQTLGNGGVPEICRASAGDVCKAGVAGTNPGELSNASIRDFLAYSPAEDAIVVGDIDRIQAFDTDGTYRGEIPFTGALAAFAGRSVSGLDTDAAGNIYFSLAGVEDVYKISATGTPISPAVPGASAFEAESPLGVAVDAAGGVYVFDAVDFGTPNRVLKYDAAGSKLIPSPAEEAAGEFFPFVPNETSQASYSLTGIATNLCSGSDSPGNLYVAVFDFAEEAWIDAYGTAPFGCEPPPSVAPKIVDQYATEVTTDTATLEAQINPKFWDDTTYQIQYGTSPCSGGGCATTPASPRLLTGQVTNQLVKTSGIELAGLTPGTTYHYRFLAQSSGGGPVFGPDRSFRTFSAPEDKAPCANDGFRGGPGAELPDCRAYERVSPADKGGGDVALWQGEQALIARFFEIHRSDPSGGRFVFTSKRPFAEPESAPSISQYLAERGSGGWTSKAITPPLTMAAAGTGQMLGNNPFQLFSEDLCTAWMRSYSTAPLTPDAIPGYANLYRRDVCADGPYEALSTVEPPSRDPDEYTDLRAHRASADGSHAIFVANDKLHPDAPTIDPAGLLLYEQTPAGLRFVCYLPDGSPVSQSCAPGAPAGGRGGDQSSDRNAISADGSVIYWSAFSEGLASPVTLPTPAVIYARVGGVETVAVSGAVAPGPAVYWSASSDGSKAVFAFDTGPHAGELYEFDLGTESATLLATGVIGPMGASEDARRIYFASDDDLDSGGPGATDQRNLYFHDTATDTTAFVMELAAADTSGNTRVGAPVEMMPFVREAAVSSDGMHAAFSAFAPPPSGYENLDTQTNERVQEVYRYDAAAEQLTCISCNPTGARPETGSGPENRIVARIQGWEANGRSPRVISEDGSRVFFESFEALVARDTNGAWDVYQWEEPGTGTCTTADPSYGSESGGCVELVSSGDSPEASVFLDADVTGESVFISTRSTLIAADTDDLVDVYAARAVGGFPAPPPSPAPCEAEGCRGGAPATPEEQGAGTAVFEGPGNPPAGRGGRRHCARHSSKARRHAKAAKRRSRCRAKSNRRDQR